MSHWFRSLHEPNMFIVNFVAVGDSDQCCVGHYGNKVKDNVSSEKFTVYMDVNCRMEGLESPEKHYLYHSANQ